MTNLVNIVKKTLIASIIAVPLFFGSCQKEDYEENLAPEVTSLIANPPYGEAPLIDNISGAWRDGDGESDIKTYRWNIDKRNAGNDTTITSPTPVSHIIRTFKNPGTYDISLELIDSHGASDKETVTVEVYAKDTRTIINPTISTDANGKEFNSKNTKVDKDNIIQTRVNGDWVNTIPYTVTPLLWVCGHYADLLNTNSHNWGADIRLDDAYFHYFEDRLYNWYRGRNIDSVKYNQGTLADMGTLGLPMGIVTLIDTSHYHKGSEYEIDRFFRGRFLKKGSFGHAMNWVLTGNSLKEWKYITFIEPQNDRINVPIGEWDIPRDCDEVTLNYYYPHMEGGRTYLRWISLEKFRIKDGVPTLIWENNDPNFNIITQRKK